tara:strand:+ start:122 stop:562 length:441 start_codon:yes stop_codon:yes gene_type:complete
MDIYLISFIASTLWVGPFWFAMLLKPYDDNTKKIMNKTLFFLGPIIIWFLVMLSNPNGLIDFINSGSHPDGFFAGLGMGLSTNAGISAMWAHMVAGDIFATRWIWKNGVNNDDNVWLIRVSVFWGVMLMPLGILTYLTFRKRPVKK